MDKCREAFENWYKSDDEIDFYSRKGIAAAGFKAAWQEQQKRIDELQARVDAATNVYEKYRNGCCDIYDVFDEVEQALKGGKV